MYIFVILAFVIFLNLAICSIIISWSKLHYF
jgi:hypothetical protein